MMGRRTSNEPRRATTKPALLGLGLAALLALPGCAGDGGGVPAFFARMSGSEAVESQLAGQALAQRKASMRRIRRDLGSFFDTLVQLRRHGKTAGISRFEGFVNPYLELRVDPLVEDEAVTHPELRPFQAELLLSKAVLLHQMGQRRDLRRTISQLEQDFEAMPSMLVLYPTGEAVTLDQSIALLRRQTGES